MSLINTLQDGVEIAFANVSDLVRLGTYQTKGGDPVYDPVSDTMTGGSPKTFDKVRILETSAQAEEREASQVTVSDSKFLIPFVDLPNHDPSETDTIIMDGVDYNVVTRKKVPGQAIHIIFCRKA